MGQPVVWFEVLGKDRDPLVAFYSELFGWEASPVEGWPYSMVDTGGEGIGGGIGPPPEGSPGHVTFYVKVDDVGRALDRAEALGGGAVMGPMDMPDGSTTWHEPVGVLDGDVGAADRGGGAIRHSPKLRIYLMPTTSPRPRPPTSARGLRRTTSSWCSPRPMRAS